MQFSIFTLFCLNSCDILFEITRATAFGGNEVAMLGLAMSIPEINKLEIQFSLCPNIIMHRKLRSTPGAGVGALGDRKVHLQTSGSQPLVVH